MAAQILTNEPVCETLTPAPDGVVTDFSTSVDYKSGTVSVWLNGMRLVASLDTGFLELPSTVIRMKEAPKAGDTLQAQFVPL